jgi:hypothetical protein
LSGPQGGRIGDQKGGDARQAFSKSHADPGTTFLDSQS